MDKAIGSVKEDRAVIEWPVGAYQRSSDTVGALI